MNESSLCAGISVRSWPMIWKPIEKSWSVLPADSSSRAGDPCGSQATLNPNWPEKKSTLGW